MIRIAVCDDEEEVLSREVAMVREYHMEGLAVDGYTSGAALLNAGLEYDIILLDIDMEGMNGIETARRIRARDKKVKLIYVTNYSDYTIFAFAVHAFAYLLKPLRREDLFRQLEEALAYRSAEGEDEMEFQAREGIVRIKPSDILCFEYQSRQVLMYTRERIWHLKKKITDVEQEMRESGFAMPHKSFVVNLYAVQSIHGYDITLSDGSVVPLSQKKAAQFRKALNQYLAGRRR